VGRVRKKKANAREHRHETAEIAGERKSGATEAAPARGANGRVGKSVRPGGTVSGGAAVSDDDLAAGWFPLWLVAAAFGVTRQGFHDIVRPLISAADVRGAGERGTKVRCRGAIDAWVGHKLGMSEDPDAAALFGGSQSPALEEWRKYKAGQEKIKLDLMRKMAFPREQLEPALGAFAAALRRAGETLQRQYGDDAASVLNDALNEAVGSWEKLLKDSQ
jgi:hypothetical protein